MTALSFSADNILYMVPSSRKKYSHTRFPGQLLLTISSMRHSRRCVHARGQPPSPLCSSPAPYDDAEDVGDGVGVDSGVGVAVGVGVATSVGFTTVFGVAVVGFAVGMGVAVGVGVGVVSAYT